MRIMHYVVFKFDNPFHKGPWKDVSTEDGALFDAFDDCVKVIYKIL